MPLRLVPEGLCVPPVPKDEDERAYLPQLLLVNFRPKQNVLYNSLTLLYWIHVDFNVWSCCGIIPKR